MALAEPKAEPGIDFETLMEQVGFTPHNKAQHQYLYSRARFNIPCCGRRWGKTMPTGHRMTYKSFIPHSYNWIVGPTYKQGEKEFRVVMNDYERLGLLRHCTNKRYDVKGGNMTFKTPWKSVVEVVSAEKPASLQGEGLSHAVMSEAATHNRVTWEQYIEPALSDLLGTADFPSTPKGFNWYHGIWLMGQNNYHPDYRSWQLPSWTNLIRYPGGRSNEEIKRIENTVSKLYFDQEYGASFTAITGSIYEEWNDAKHIAKLHFDPNLPNYLAFDYGWGNPFVALDIQVTPGDKIHVWREYYQRHISTMEHGEYLKNRENPQNYRIDAMWGDPRGADEAATLALILGFVASFDVPWKSSVELIKRMLKADPPQILVDPSCTNLIREFPQLHRKPLSRNATQDIDEQRGDGNLQHKVDDHALDAFRYFVGPHFVAGAGTHLSDLYGQDYHSSESADMFTTLSGSDTSVLMDQQSIDLGRVF